jgi:hypothetical protein
MKIVGFEQPGLIVERRSRGRSTITYGEILTAERLASGRGLRLHTRVADPAFIACRGIDRTRLERELRKRGVRVVDEWGAIIAPTLEDFEAELARGPKIMRQSSDNA